MTPDERTDLRLDEPTLAVVVVAAGASRRFGTDKLFASLGGRPVLAWSLRALESTPCVGEVVLVTSTENLARGRHLVDRHEFLKARLVISGGARRQDSVWNGIRAVIGARWVAIHDGARPFLTRALIERGLQAARDNGGAVAALPVKDTIKVIEQEPLIARTPDRRRLWAAQTPQVFDYEKLVQAFEANHGADVTDDAELFERASFPVAVYPGDEENLKITTPVDLIMARAIARARRVGGR